VQSTSETPNGPLVLDVYPGEDCRGALYFDDGVHVRGPVLRQTIQCTVTPKGVSLQFGRREGGYRPWWKSIAVTVHGAQVMHKTIPDQPRAASIEIVRQ